MDRYINSFILKDLEKKIVLLSGPRQVGKTTIASSLVSHCQYLNYDLDEHRSIINEKTWDRSKSLIIFDELHKKTNWKRWIKGIYDTEGLKSKILITGSARLDVIKKMGDSLAGRFFQYRLHPLDLKEIKNFLPSEAWDETEVFNRLMEVGGFPEPFLTHEADFYPRWKKSHIDIILRQDLLDLETVRSISGIETLISLLRTRVGSTVSFSSLARDLEVDSKTVKRWVTILENLYVIFKVTPYHRNIARSLLKEPKYYFYDCGQVRGDSGAKLENLVACALWKELHFLEDTKGAETNLHFLRNKEQKEIDFLVAIDSQIKLLLEVKWKNSELSPHFGNFEKYFPNVKQIQLSGILDVEKTYPPRQGVIAEIRKASHWLSHFQLL